MRSRKVARTGKRGDPVKPAIAREPAAGAPLTRTLDQAFPPDKVRKLARAAEPPKRR